MSSSKEVSRIGKEHSNLKFVFIFVVLESTSVYTHLHEAIHFTSKKKHLTHQKSLNQLDIIQSKFKKASI
jgi:hypothetical protein